MAKQTVDFDDIGDVERLRLRLAQHGWDKENWSQHYFYGRLIQDHRGISIRPSFAHNLPSDVLFLVRELPDLLLAALDALDATKAKLYAAERKLDPQGAELAEFERAYTSAFGEQEPGFFTRNTTVGQEVYADERATSAYRGWLTATRKQQQ